jgi:hypothetical protein
MHFGAAPIISVRGDEADGSWRLFATMTALDGRALWAGANYDDTYRRTDRGWRIQSARVTVGFNTPFEADGWVTTKYVPLASGRRGAAT